MLTKETSQGGRAPGPLLSPQEPQRPWGSFSIPAHPPSKASLLIQWIWKMFWDEGGPVPRLPPLQLGVLGCCLSRPRGLIPGDTLPPATSSRLLSSVSSAQSRGASARGGGVAALPADQRAGRARKEAFLPHGGAGAEATGFHVPGRTALCCWLPGRLPGACPVLQRVTAQGGCGGRQPRCPFWLLDYECLMGEAGDEDKDGRVWGMQSVGAANLLPSLIPFSAGTAHHPAQDPSITLGGF